LDKEDDVVDNLTDEFNEAIKAESEDIGLDAGIALNRIARFLERIADHAVNVGVNTVYIVTGELPRRSGAEESSGE
jgi:phosphate transport system protein